MMMQPQLATLLGAPSNLSSPLLVAGALTANAELTVVSATRLGGYEAYIPKLVWTRFGTQQG